MFHSYVNVYQRVTPRNEQWFSSPLLLLWVWWWQLIVAIVGQVVEISLEIKPWKHTLMTHILFVQRHLDFGCHFLREACALRATLRTNTWAVARIGKNLWQGLSGSSTWMPYSWTICRDFSPVVWVMSACFMFLLYGSKHFLGRCLTAEIIPQVFPENDILGHGLYTIDCSACCQPWTKGGSHRWPLNAINSY